MQPAADLTNPGTDANVDKGASLTKAIAESLTRSREESAARQQPSQERQQKAPERVPEKERSAEPEAVTEGVLQEGEGTATIEPEEESSEEPLRFTLEDLADAAGYDDVKEFMKTVDVPVKWKDGDQKTIDLKGVVDGYRWDGYNARKAEELSAQRKQIEQVQQDWTNRIAYADALIKAQLQDLDREEAALNQQYQMVPWQQLRASGDGSYADAEAEFSRARTLIEQKRRMMTQQAERVAQEWHQEQQRRLNEVLPKLQSRVLESLPHWEDERAASREKEEIAKWAGTNYGFTPEESAQMLDPRMWHAFHDLWKLKTQMDKGEIAKKKVKDAPKLMKPGRARAKQDAKTQMKEKLARRLKQSGSRNDLAAMIMNR